jgi:hypothetical protein
VMGGGAVVCSLSPPPPPAAEAKYLGHSSRNEARGSLARLKSMFSWLTLRLDRHLMHAVRSDRRFGLGSLLVWLTVAVGALGNGCSSGASGGSGPTGGATGGGDANGTGGEIAEDAGGISLDGSSGGFTGTGGLTGTGTGGALGTGGLTSSGAGGATSAGSGGLKGTGGATATGSGGSPGTGGSPGAGGSTGKGGSTASGGSTGSGGTTGAGGAAGRAGGSGGTSTSGSAGGKGTAGSSGSGFGGVTGAGGTTTGGFCPPGAIFCADFEEASGPPVSNPVGTASFQDPNESGATFGSGVMDLDAGNSPFDGKQSLRIDPSSGVSVRTLAVAVPATFWVRLYMKSDLAIGQLNRNSFFGAGTDPVYTMGNYVELSEQYGCVLLNKNGMLFPTGTTCGANSALAANSWHCVTAEFDGTTGNVHVYSGATQIINAAAWAPAIEAFNSFSFGYFAYNPNGATVWYDDVVISASPLSCP